MSVVYFSNIFKPSKELLPNIEFNNPKNRYLFL